MHRPLPRHPGSPPGYKKLDVRITLRMPEDLAALVQEAADADRRSKSDCIVLQLEAIFAKRAREGRQVGGSSRPAKCADGRVDAMVR